MTTKPDAEILRDTAVLVQRRGLDGRRTRSAERAARRHRSGVPEAVRRPAVVVRFTHPQATPA